MPKLTIVDREGNEKTVTGDAGLSLMEVILDSGFDGLFAVCGGCCSCGTCHVYVDEAWQDQVGGAHDDESDLLDSGDHRQQNSRLSCQMKFTDELDGLKVTVAPED